MKTAPHRRIPRFPALLVVCGMATTLLGCPAHSGHLDDDPLASVQAEPSGFAIKGRMYLTVKAPRWDVSGKTSTTMVIHRPADLYLQVRGPVNNVMLQGTANERELVLVIPPMNKAFTAASPDAAMQALTGGALGIDGVLAMLMARLPNIELETDQILEEPRERTFMLTAPGDYKIQATIDRKRHRLRGLTIRDREQETLVEVQYEGSFRDARAYYPELMTMNVPALDLELKADFQAWEVMGEVPSIFTTPVPDGAEVTELEQMLEEGVSLPPATDAHPRP
jgi:hypothetical protein